MNNSFSTTDVQLLKLELKLRLKFKLIDQERVERNIHCVPCSLKPLVKAFTPFFGLCVGFLCGCYISAVLEQFCMLKPVSFLGFVCLRLVCFSPCALLCAPIESRLKSSGRWFEYCFWILRNPRPTMHEWWQTARTRTRTTHPHTAAASLELLLNTWKKLTLQEAIC